MRSAWLVLLIAWVGCSEPPAPAPPPSVPSPAPPRPSSPCATDADCRLETVDGCGCIVVLSSTPPGPGCSHPCFAYPCMNQVAACVAGSCVITASTPVPSPVPAPPS